MLLLQAHLLVGSIFPDAARATPVKHKTIPVINKKHLA
jgi:hypothetical protein